MVKRLAPSDHRPLVYTRADGTVVIQPGSLPAPGSERLADALRIGGIAVIGIGGFGAVDALALTGVAAAVLEVAALAAFVTAAALPIRHRRRGRLEQVEIDWRREEVRVAGEGALTLTFAAIDEVRLEMGWATAACPAGTWDVWLTGAERVLLARFEAREEAEALQGELRELIRPEPPSPA